MKKIILKNKAWFFLTIALKVTIGIVFVEVPLSLQRIINAIQKGDKTDFKKWVIIALICFVFVAIFDYLNRIVQAKYMEKTLSFMKQKIFNGLINKNHDDFYSKNTSEYISVLTNDINLIDKNYIAPLLEGLGDVVIMIRSVVVLLQLNIIIACILFAMSVVILTLPHWFGKSLEEKQEEYSRGLATYTSKIKDLFLGYGIIEAFNMRKKVIANHNKYSSEVRHKEYNAIKAVSKLAAFSTYLCITTEVMAVSLGGIFFFKGTLLLGDLFAIVKLNDYLISPMEEIAAKFTLVRSMKEVVAKINIYIKIENEDDKGMDNFEFKDKITFDNVTFSYDNTETPAISNLNISFKKGKKYVIVGRSGSGKSTIINLLLRYYDYQSGKLLIDNRKIEDISKQSLYDNVAVIHQDIYMFDKSLKDNIALDREYNDSDIKRVLKESGVDLFLPLLEEGLDTVLKENGSRLSGGQRQRVAIARALLKKKDILLLDEATSSLDEKTYLEIENTVLDISDVTIISVTHRLSEIILSKYDEVIVIGEGNVLEKGTYSKLIEKKGYFYDLCNNKC